MSFLILVCERCADVGMFKAGVYRDLHGETLCDACDDDRDREQQAIPVGAYARPMETDQPKRDRFQRRW